MRKPSSVANRVAAVAVAVAVAVGAVAAGLPIMGGSKNMCANKSNLLLLPLLPLLLLLHELFLVAKASPKCAKNVCSANRIIN